MKLLTVCIALAVVFGLGEADPQGFGAPAGADINSEGVQSAAKFATSVISDGYGGSNHLGLVRVTKASHQVVAGSLYTMTLAAGRTNCPKGSQDKALCNIAAGADDAKDVDYNECEVTVVDQSWLTPRYKVLKLKCNKPNKNEVV